MDGTTTTTQTMLKSAFGYSEGLPDTFGSRVGKTLRDGGGGIPGMATAKDFWTNKADRLAGYKPRRVPFNDMEPPVEPFFTAGPNSSWRDKIRSGYINQRDAWDNRRAYEWARKYRKHSDIQQDIARGAHPNYGNTWAARASQIPQRLWNDVPKSLQVAAQALPWIHPATMPVMVADHVADGLGTTGRHVTAGNYGQAAAHAVNTGATATLGAKVMGLPVASGLARKALPAYLGSAAASKFLPIHSDNKAIDDFAAALQELRGYDLEELRNLEVPKNLWTPYPANKFYPYNNLYNYITDQNVGATTVDPGLSYEAYTRRQFDPKYQITPYDTTYSKGLRYWMGQEGLERQNDLIKKLNARYPRDPSEVPPASLLHFK